MSFWKALFITLILVIIVGSVLLIANPTKTTEIVITPGNPQKGLKYSIYGAVESPGTYSVEHPIRIEEAVETAGGLAENADEEGAHLAKWIIDGETVIIPTKSLDRPTLTPIVQEEELIDLNSADIRELMKLPGIGEKRASDIVRLREEKGGFITKEELLEISGISERILENIYDRLIIR